MADFGKTGRLTLMFRNIKVKAPPAKAGGWFKKRAKSKKEMGEEQKKKRAKSKKL